MEVLFIILACWLLTYFLHSTAFYGLAKLIALTPTFAHNRAKEILWKVAICGGLFTASVQVFTGTGIFTSSFINNINQVPKESQPQTKVLINPILDENNTSKVAESPILGVQTNINQINDSEVLAGLSKTSIKGNLTDSISYLSSNNRLFIIGVSIWGLIATISFVRLLRQKHLFFRSILPRHKVIDEDLLYTLFKLCSWGGIEQKIVLTFSKNLFSPLAIGRGEICLPARSFTELSPEQQKSMLAHELAHIVRKDFAWLKLFNFLETVFFFQPLNRLMRVELQEVTEQRCDEWAIRSTGASKPLADCLVKVAEWLTEPTAIRFASGMALHQSSLRQRIKNILKNQYFTQQKLNRMKVIILLAILLLSITFILPGKTWLSVSFAHDSKLANLYNHHEISIGEQGTPTVAELEDIDAVSEMENIELPTSPESIEVPIIVSSLHEEEMMRVGDTLRFGKDFMLITKGNGNFEIYKDGKYIVREDYEKYKEDFIVKNDNSIEILSKSGIRVSTGNDDYTPMFPKWNLDMGESLPALAPTPRWNGGFSGGFSRNWGAFGFSDDDYTYSWTEDGEDIEAEFDKEDNLISLRINDKEIEKADFPKYQKSIDKAKESIKKN
nr:M56 family metallopeptidase [Thermoflexibacter sp.]